MASPTHCARCAAPITQKGRGRPRKYCFACVDAGIYQAGRAKPAEERVCAHCGELFQTVALDPGRRPQRKFCSDACRKKANQESGRMANLSAARAAVVREQHKLRRKRRQLTDPVYRARQRARQLARNAKHRARKLEAETEPGVSAHVRSCYGQPCAYCGAPSATHDHVVPLARGGAHTIANIVPACKPCNCAKSDRPVEEFRANAANRNVIP